MKKQINYSSNFSEGVYFVHVYQDNTLKETHRLVIVR